MFGTSLAQPRHAANPSRLYMQVSVDGAAAGGRSGYELVALLFDGLLGAIARARGAMRAGDIVVKTESITRALSIVGDGLRSGLNLRDGGRLAADLNDLYNYVELRLTQANLRNDDAALEECARLLKTLQDAWTAIGPQVQRAR
jgi:flagellar secretion chaperone FliS